MIVSFPWPALKQSVLRPFVSASLNIAGSFFFVLPPTIRNNSRLYSSTVIQSPFVSVIVTTVSLLREITNIAVFEVFSVTEDGVLVVHPSTEQAIGVVSRVVTRDDEIVSQTGTSTAAVSGEGVVALGEAS